MSKEMKMRRTNLEGLGMYLRHLLHLLHENRLVVIAGLGTRSDCVPTILDRRCGEMT